MQFVFKSKISVCSERIASEDYRFLEVVHNEVPPKEPDPVSFICHDKMNNGLFELELLPISGRVYAFCLVAINPAIKNLAPLPQGALKANIHPGIPCMEVTPPPGSLPVPFFANFSFWMPSAREVYFLFSKAMPASEVIPVNGYRNDNVHYYFDRNEIFCGVSLALSEHQANDVQLWLEWRAQSWGKPSKGDSSTL